MLSSALVGPLMQSYINALSKDDKNELLDLAVTGYGHSPQMAVLSGSMLRTAITTREFAAYLLNNALNDIFAHLQSRNFEVSSDAWATFKMMLTQHKELTDEYLNVHYDEFFPAFMTLLNPDGDGYTACREALSLLADLICYSGPAEYRVRFISEAKHLICMLNLLNHESRIIKLLTFHVFKVFVAAPAKSRQVHKVLVRNRDELLKFFENFFPDSDSAEFTKDKAYVIEQIASVDNDAGMLSTSDPSVNTAAAAAAAGRRTPPRDAGSGGDDAGAGSASASASTSASAGSSSGKEQVAPQAPPPQSRRRR
ncbi:uncharacterized protein AMSG_03865 [Thecamonas trahens ATCC 50062]|uniref:Uncharacterized protein n=1 Tax=Thecamonas trahens ATCC 50062 TaxID=461836 RepID=A0A0L0D4Y2_THETB|nr:hypothetical protein AMSG_03865 [Thecamonas trahens ATCC 50062]KNC47432.1 hypothetical protein AMSG_03865 [Thecamonas trahens ATCC 50062]|eukprot:XP_013759768.1 hypothetical protein AMSG_03865 [Thecamonas trahens ATCC 50062]